MKTEIYNIDGMSCAACSSAVERVTRRLEGVQESNVNLTTAKMTITYDEALVTQEMIEEKVDKAGFKADCGNLFCGAAFIYFDGTYGAVPYAGAGYHRYACKPVEFRPDSDDFNGSCINLRKEILSGGTSGIV